ncbi:MAG: hypothetical protein LBR35_02055 [Rickettsiales bacterium]|jgi:ribosomal protein S17|nr:hypothetical protein [Rickettsiales bacterium]
MNKSYAFLKSVLAGYGLVGLDIVGARKIDDESFVKKQYELFDKNYKRFLRHIATHHVRDLQNMKVIREDIVNMIDGVMPENATLIFKILPEYGGEANEHNILLMPLHPYNDYLIDFFNQQLSLNHCELPDEYYGIKYEKLVFYPNYFLRAGTGGAIPERIENER